MSDLWYFDYWIPLYDSLLVELIRAATLWIVWLTRNNICFQNSPIPSIRSVAASIISLTLFWCKSRLDNSYFKLSLIIPFDVSSLPQIGPLIVLSDTDAQDQDSSPLDSDVDPGLGLEGLDLADYLSDRAVIDAIDRAAGLLPSISSSSASASSSSVIAIFYSI